MAINTFLQYFINLIYLIKVLNLIAGGRKYDGDDITEVIGLLTVITISKLLEEMPYLV